MPEHLHIFESLAALLNPAGAAYREYYAFLPLFLHKTTSHEGTSTPIPLFFLILRPEYHPKTDTAVLYSTSRAYITPLAKKKKII